jgi:hypothetical protein
MKVTNNRCSFTYRDGRRCRMLIIEDGTTLCPYHGQAARKEVGLAPPSSSPLIVPGILDTRRAVRRALKRVYREVVAGRIAPDRAAVLAYLGQVLLTGLPLRSRRMRAARAILGMQSAKVQ